MYLLTEWFGSFLVDERGTIVDKRLFPKDAAEISARLRSIEAGETLQEETELAAASEQSVIVREERLSGLGELGDAEAPKIDPSRFGFSWALLAQASTPIQVERADEAMTDPEHRVIQAVSALDDLNRSINLISLRVIEWRKHVPTGGEDPAPLTALQGHLDAMLSSKEGLEEFIRYEIVETAPNLANIVDPLIAARLVAQAGSLKRLASMPASTLQLLGAEKALFRHLKEGGSPPKHGYIFQHSQVKTARNRDRGRVARAIAGKAVIAARADHFDGEEIWPLLQEKLDRRLKEIKEGGK